MSFLKKYSTLCLSFTALLLSGCLDELSDFTNVPSRHQIYSVDPGEHEFTPRFTITNYPPNELAFKANLHPNTLYTDEDLGGKTQVNKLFGFTDCNSADPQENSARFGWIAINGKMKIVSYVDRSGDHLFDLASGLEIELGKFYTYKIRISGSQYIFTVSDDGQTLYESKVERNCSSTVFKNILNPYFGGQTPAPHRMDVEIELL